jgi:spore coat protein H
MGHNYYIYLNPETNKFVFIPWDMDLSLAGFFFAGGPDQQLDLSITHPYTGQHNLIARLLAMKDVHEKYLKVVKDLTSTCFTKERLLKDIASIDEATKDIRAKEKKALEARKERTGGFGPPGGAAFGGTPDLRTFVEKRTESVAAQLAGKSTGYEPTMAFGPGAGPMGPRPGEILPPPIQNDLRLTDAQKKQLAQLQKETDSKIEKILTADQNKQLKELQRPPVAFGPGNFFARPVLDVLDSNKDGKLSKSELLAGVKKLFQDCDKEGKGTIDEKALADGVGRLFPPPPPGFGPPGFGPPGGGPPGGGPPGGPMGIGGPGVMLASSVMKRVSAGKDGKITLEKLSAAAETLFQESDKDKNGSLDETELAAAITVLFPPPPAFGPPGGGPPMGGFGGPPPPPQQQPKKGG